MSDVVRAFGWIPQLPDIRDKNFHELAGISLLKAKALPEVVDLRPRCPKIYDQSTLGSCTANAIAFLCHYEMLHDENLKEDFMPSRLFIYYNERWMENSIGQDAGAIIRDGIKSLNLWGFPPEKLWPYQIPQFADKPSPAAYKQAAKKKVRVKDYGAVEQNEIAMKQALASGFPIVIGFAVYQSLMTKEVASTGIVPMPKAGERMIGGHAVAIVGYNSQGWICRNSWGEGWGQAGYFIMPYEYLTNPKLAADLWIVRLIP